VLLEANSKHLKGKVRCGGIVGVAAICLEKLDQVRQTQGIVNALMASLMIAVEGRLTVRGVEAQGFNQGATPPGNRVPGA